MSATNKAQDKLALTLADLMEPQTLPQRSETMASAAQAFETANLIPGPQAVRMNPDEPLAFALDLIGDNPAVGERLNLNPGLMSQALRATDPLQLAQTLAL
jgi:hypothetical protein